MQSSQRQPIPDSITGQVQLEKWKTFLLKPEIFSILYDYRYYYRLLEKHQESLFARDPSNIQLEAWSASPGHELHKSTILTDLSLETYLKTHKDSERETTAFFISQATTWSRIRLSIEMFCRLCDSFQITPTFLESATTFGHKRADTDGYYSVCHSLSSLDAETMLPEYEICYNLRHIQLHGRNRTDPWSFRNFAVYHRYSTTKPSIWLFINVPEAVQEHIERILSNATKVTSHPILWHSYFLMVSLYNWRWYINYLEEIFQDISEAVTFSDTETARKPDYTLNFSQCQKLGKLRNKLERSLCILDSDLKIADEILLHSTELEKTRHLEEHDSRCLRNELRKHQSVMRGHICRLKMLLQSCDLTAQMLCQLLALRNDTLIQTNGASLKDLATRTAAENRSLVILSRETSIDSRATRIATFIMLAYVPASIVAALFNSNLVDLGPLGEQPGLVVRKEIWAFIIASAGLSFITLMAWWLLERKEKQRLRGMS